ncbi:hypothetical protein J6253_04150, partial [bacterium]|nr:hypothetical protein [bacterium]
MKKIFSFSLLIVLALVFAVSCGGGKSGESSKNDTDNVNDEDPGRKQGELYGECYPNGTCNKGLVCDEENNICIKDPGNTEEPEDDTDKDDGKDDDDTDTSAVVVDDDTDTDSPDTTPDHDTDTDQTDPAPDEDNDSDTDTETPEVTENHKISGSYQIGRDVSGIEAALYECGQNSKIASANTNTSGKYSFNADISAEKTYCVKANGFASCFKGMSDHTANISEITDAAYLLDTNCTDMRKSETVLRAYAKLGTGEWLGELDYSKLSGIKEGLKLLSSFLSTTDSKTLSQKIAEDAKKTEKSFVKFFNGFKVLSDKNEVVINTADASSNEIKFNIEGSSNAVAEGFRIVWTALNSTNISATHKIATVNPGEYIVRAKLVYAGGDPIMISEDSLSVFYLLEKLSGTIDVSDMSKDISHYITNGIYAVIPKNTVIRKGNSKVNTLTYKILTTGDGSQVSKISFEPEGTTFSGDSMYFIYELGTVFGGDPIMLSSTRTNSDGSSNVLESTGGDPIMLEAGGDPIMFSAGGDPIMQIARSAGGDPIMMSAGGDPIMMDDGGDPIMSAAAGDPIMITAGGDPIMAGDPIMMGTSSSVMVAKTGHFSGFMLHSNTLQMAVDKLIEKWCSGSYYHGYSPLEFIRQGIQKYKPAGEAKERLLSYFSCSRFGELESDLYELINRPLGHHINLNLFENIFYISEFYNRLSLKKANGEKAAVKNGLDLKAAIAALYTATTAYNRSSTTADSFDSAMIPMTYSGSSPADYSSDAQKAITGLSEINNKYVASKKELMIFANYITTSSKGPDFSEVSSQLTTDQLICAWMNPDTNPASCNKVYTLNAAGHVAIGNTEVSVDEANNIFKKFFMPFNSRLSNAEKLNIFRTFYLTIRYAGTLFHSDATVETMNDDLLETAYLVFDGIDGNVNAVSIVDTFNASAHTVQVLENGDMETKPYLSKLSTLTDKISLNVTDPANVEKVLIKIEGSEFDKITENTRTYYKPKGSVKEKSIILNPGNMAAGLKPLKDLIGTDNVDELGNITGKMTVVVNSTISGKSYTTQKTYEFLVNDTTDGVESKPLPSNLTVFLFDSAGHAIAENKNPGIILNPGSTVFYPNEDGIINITDLNPASYTIDAFADGYYAKNVGVNVPENATLSVEIRLDEEITNSAEALLTVKVKINTVKHPDKVYLQIYDEEMNLVANESAKFDENTSTYEDVDIDINFGRY